MAFAMNAPAAMAGHTSIPKIRRAARAMPVGAQTGVALPCATDKDKPAFAEAT